MTTYAIRRSALAVAIAAIGLSGTAHADAGKTISISGFGTVGVVHSDSDQADYAATMYQPSGPGRSRATDFTTDTKGGLQVDGNVTDQVSAVLQVTSRKLSNNSFTPKVEWANVKYQVTPDLSVRAGRIVLATFMLSDARLVGYTLTPVRPPVEFYNMAPPTNSDGVDMTYRSRIGGAGNTLMVSYGKYKGEFPLDTPAGKLLQSAQADHIVNVSDTVEFGELSVHAAYMQTDLTIFGRTAKLDVKTIGAIYDHGDWFTEGEYATVNKRGLSKDAAAWWGLAGYRWNAFTPYVMYSRQMPSDRNESGSATEQRTTAAGIRWDFRKNVDVKLQYETVRTPGTLSSRGSSSFFMDKTPGFLRNGGSVNLLSATMDFWF